MAGDIPKKKGNIEVRKLGGECLLYDHDAGKIHHMNPTATFIWEKCDECSSKEELQAELKRSFPDVDTDRLENDLNSSLDNFIDLKLMVSQG